MVREERETDTAQIATTALRALDCLRELALEKGLDDVSMRDVARRLGISLAALQYHYASKAALLDAFVEATVAPYGERIEAILAGSAAGERFANVVRFAAEETLAWDRDGVLAMVEARASHDTASREAVRQFMQSYVAFMRDAVLADNPAMAPAKALLAASLVVALLEGLPAAIAAGGGLGASRDEIVESAVRTAAAIPATLV